MSNSSMPFSRTVFILKTDEDWLVRRNIPGRRMEQGARSRNFDVSVHFMYFHYGEKRSLVWRGNLITDAGREGAEIRNFRAPVNRIGFGLKNEGYSGVWEFGNGFLKKAGS